MAYSRMSFANHNILDIALSIIPPTVVQIRKNLGTVVNTYGQSEAIYSEWLDVYGIVQPGSEQNEHTQGIDFSKKHVTIWLRGVALDGTHVQWAPDQIRYVGSIYNVVGVKDWYPYDNYRECDCVEAMNLADNQRGANGLFAGLQRMQSKFGDALKSATKRANEAKGQELTTDHDEETKESSPPSDLVAPQDISTSSLVGKAKIRF